MYQIHIQFNIKLPCNTTFHIFLPWWGPTDLSRNLLPKGTPMAVSGIPSALEPSNIAKLRLQNRKANINQAILLVELAYEAPPTQSQTLITPCKTVWKDCIWGLLETNEKTNVSFSQHFQMQLKYVSPLKKNSPLHFFPIKNVVENVQSQA